MYVCDLCNRNFSTQSSLKRHRQSVHHQSDGFSCQVCGQRFYRKDVLQRHLKTHRPPVVVRRDLLDVSADASVELPPPLPVPPPPESHGERPVCNLCARSFASQKTLKRHRETVHRQSDGFSCRVCDRRFYRREHVKKHHLRKHGDEEYEAPASYRCPVCSKSFHYRGHLREHLKSHPGATSSPAAAPVSPWVPAASAFRPDARACPAKLLDSVPEDCRQCYSDHWSQIRSHQWGGKRVLVHTQRLETASDIRDMLRAIFREQRNAFKINLAFGFILSNVETGEKRYCYPSQNGLIFDHPLVVADEADLERELQRVGETDWLEYVRQQKPNSKWRIALLTNVTFHLYPLEDRPVGRGNITGQLPKWLVENQGLDALEKDKKTGQL